jgi:hypothetical protein
MEMDILCLTDILVDRYRPPMTAPNVHRPWPNIVPKAITGTLCPIRDSTHFIWDDGIMRRGGGL